MARGGDPGVPHTTADIGLTARVLNLLVAAALTVLLRAAPSTTGSDETEHGDYTTQRQELATAGVPSTMAAVRQPSRRRRRVSPLAGWRRAHGAARPGSPVRTVPLGEQLHQPSRTGGGSR